MKLFPERFGLAGYKSIFTNPTMLRPFLISCYTTVMGTVMGLLISVLGAYVLIQWKMPGRAFVANVLLFTMIFNGGMIPTYLVMKEFHLTNNLWGVILLPAINVYNLVLMKNFFEGIPVSLMESAEIDGCSHFRILYKIVLPLSKAALASIGLMYAVGYWNDYTNYKLYITNSNLYNFQMKLRDCGRRSYGKYSKKCSSYRSNSAVYDHLSILPEIFCTGSKYRGCKRIISNNYRKQK